MWKGEYGQLLNVVAVAQIHFGTSFGSFVTVQSAIKLKSVTGMESAGAKVRVI
jgi:hypothetical protein